MARMNHGDYISEIISVVVAPNHTLVISNSETNNWSQIVTDFEIDIMTPDADDTMSSVLEWVCQSYLDGARMP